MRSGLWGSSDFLIAPGAHRDHVSVTLFDQSEHAERDVAYRDP